jgi:hypothetical protein
LHVVVNLADAEARVGDDGVERGVLDPGKDVPAIAADDLVSRSVNLPALMGSIYSACAICC